MANFTAKQNENVAALRRVLNARQFECLDLICGECRSLADVASRLGIARSTIKNHMCDIHLLTGRSTEQLCRWLGRQDHELEAS